MSDTLSLYMSNEGILINPSRLKYFLMGISSLLEQGQDHSSSDYLNLDTYSDNSSENKNRYDTEKSRHLTQVDSINAKSKAISKNKASNS